MSGTVLRQRREKCEYLRAQSSYLSVRLENLRAEAIKKEAIKEALDREIARLQRDIELMEGRSND